MESVRKYQHTSNDTTKLLGKLNTVLYLCGFTDFWIEDVKLAATFIKFYDFISYLIEFLMFSFMILEVGAFITQNNLSNKQEADRLVFGISHPILYIYCVNLIYYKKDVREILYQLAAKLKMVYNDEEVEKNMSSKLKFYLMAYVSSYGLCMVFYGASALIQYIRIGSPFTTVITAWPDVSDTSPLAHVSRVVFYIMWWIYSTRISASYILILSTFILLSFQYRNLCCYFIELEKVFEKKSDLSVLEREFELRFKLGVKLHTKTLW